MDTGVQLNKGIPLIIDLDGVLKIGNDIAPKTEAFIELVNNRNIPACILSNTTLISADSIVNFFDGHNISLGKIKVLTALDLTVEYVSKNYRRYSVYCDDQSKTLFENANGENAEAVVIGDLGEGWTYETMNEIFGKVRAGADIIAMQMNRFWRVPDKGICMDAGPFIKAIEYATSKEAILIGKPSPIAFEMAVDATGLPAGQPAWPVGRAGSPKKNGFYMLGDDLESDIKAAQDAGGEGILIMTGKTDHNVLERTDIKPAYIAGDLNEVMGMLR